MMSMRLSLVVFGAVALLAGCATAKKAEPAPDFVTLAGRVVTTDAAPLPADAVVTVRLLDVSWPDEPPKVLAEQSLAQPGNPPVAFTLRYRPSEAERGHRFVLDARIEFSGRLRYYSTASQPVRLDGMDGAQELVVAPANR